MSWIALGTTLVGTAGSFYQSRQTGKAASKAVDAQRQIAADLKYEPIDIEALKADVAKQAVENATASLALERQLQPDVAAQREATNAAKLELARQVGADLKLGGELPPDIINRVTQAGRVIGSTSGIGTGSTVPLTASLLGLSALDLQNQRRSQAAALQGPGELPVAGMDPGTLAQLEVQQNAAMNDFNAAKAGIDSNLAQSEAAARTAQVGGQVGMISSLANLLGQGIGALGTSSGGGGMQVPQTTSGLGLLQTPKFLGGSQPFAVPTS